MFGSWLCAQAFCASVCLCALNVLPNGVLLMPMVYPCLRSGETLFLRADDPKAIDVYEHLMERF